MRELLHPLERLLCSFDFGIGEAGALGALAEGAAASGTAAAGSAGVGASMGALGMGAGEAGLSGAIGSGGLAGLSSVPGSIYGLGGAGSMMGTGMMAPAAGAAEGGMSVTNMLGLNQLGQVMNQFPSYMDSIKNITQGDLSAELANATKGSPMAGMGAPATPVATPPLQGPLLPSGGFFSGGLPGAPGSISGTGTPPTPTPVPPIQPPSPWQSAAQGTGDVAKALLLRQRPVIPVPAVAPNAHFGPGQAAPKLVTPAPGTISPLQRFALMLRKV